MDYNSIIWLFIPVLVLVIWVVLAKARPSVLVRNRRNTIIGIIIALIILAVYYFIRFVMFPE